MPDSVVLGRLTRLDKFVGIFMQVTKDERSVEGWEAATEFDKLPVRVIEEVIEYFVEQFQNVEVEDYFQNS